MSNNCKSATTRQCFVLSDPSRRSGLPRQCDGSLRRSLRADRRGAAHSRMLKHILPRQSKHETRFHSICMGGCRRPATASARVHIFTLMKELESRRVQWLCSWTREQSRPKNQQCSDSSRRFSYLLTRQRGITPLIWNVDNGPARFRELSHACLLPRKHWSGCWAKRSVRDV